LYSLGQRAVLDTMPDPIVTASDGVAVCELGATIDEIIDSADQAHCYAKNSERNRAGQ
jgi:PleD family two-component response regulator